jgi:hypothetical protein
MGWANSGFCLPDITASMERRRASARPTPLAVTTSVNPQVAEEDFAPNHGRHFGCHITDFGAQNGFLTTDYIGR